VPPAVAVNTNVTEVCLTHNAVVGFHRVLCPTDSLSGAYRELRRECKAAQYIAHAPSWLRRTNASNDGYLLLDGEIAALPIRRGRAVACLVNPNDDRGVY
jgi:hypothetical protein